MNKNQIPTYTKKYTNKEASKHLLHLNTVCNTSYTFDIPTYMRT